MPLKVRIFRRNALIYIKVPHVFHWPTFSPLHSLPQVHVSRDEELDQPFPDCARQASGPPGRIHKGGVDQRVEGLQGWRGGQTLQALHSTLSQQSSDPDFP